MELQDLVPAFYDPFKPSVLAEHFFALKKPFVENVRLIERAILGVLYVEDEVLAVIPGLEHGPASCAIAFKPRTCTE